MADTIAEEKISTIVGAAAKRFAYYGFAKVTMDEIAADIGMGKASLYYYFPSKELLFKSVVEHEQTQFFLSMNALVKTNASGSEKLREYGRKRLEFFRELVNIGSIAMHASSEGKAVFTGLHTTLMQKEKKLVETIIRDAATDGEFSVHSVTQTAELFLHILQGIRLRAIKEAPTRLDDDQFITLRKEMDLFVSIFSRGIRRQD